MVVSMSDLYMIIPRSGRIDGWLEVELNVGDFIDTLFCFLYKDKIIWIQILQKSCMFLFFAINENLVNKWRNSFSIWKFVDKIRLLENIQILQNFVVDVKSFNYRIKLFIWFISLTLLFSSLLLFYRNKNSNRNTYNDRLGLLATCRFDLFCKSYFCTGWHSYVWSKFFFIREHVAIRYSTVLWHLSIYMLLMFGSIISRLCVLSVHVTYECW
jgi:hypothetical protein